MASETWLLECLGDVYAGLTDLARWSGVVAKLAKAAPGYRSAVWLVDIVTHDTSVLAAMGFEPRFVKSYVDRFARLNPYTKPLSQLQPEKVLAVGRMEPGNTHLEFRHEWLRPQDIHCAVFGMVHRHGNRVLMLGLFGKEDAADPEVVDMMKIVTPHMARAALVNQRLLDVETQRHTMAQVLNRLPMGTIIIGADRRALFMNETAKRLVDANDGLFIDREGRCRGGTPAESTVLAQAIASAVENTDGSFVAAFALDRSNADDPLSVTVAPLTLPRQSLTTERAAAAALFISAPERHNVLSPELLQRLYGLSVGESRIVQALVAGQRLEEMAESFEVSPHTVRNQLKTIFRKTGTGRQSDLVKLMLTSPASYGETKQ